MRQLGLGLVSFETNEAKLDRFVADLVRCGATVKWVDADKLKRELRATPTVAAFWNERRRGNKV